MTASLVFLIQALVIIALPVLLLRFSGLRGLVPLVTIQIMVGIVLGPSVLGRAAPHIFGVFMNALSVAPLSGIGSVAVLIFALVTGLHLDEGVFRDQGRAFILITAANVILPTLLGGCAAYWILALYPSELMPGTNPATFAFAVGICTAMTALPVLAEILREMGLLRSPIGQLALSVAGMKDAVLWIPLGVLLAAHAGHGDGAMSLVFRLLLVPVYLLLMLYIGRPVLARLMIARMRGESLDERTLAIVGVVTIASALATEAIGLSYVVGALVAGAIMPKDLRKPLIDRLQVMTVALLMPFFFILTGLRTSIDPTSSAFVGIFAIVTPLALMGIVGATAVAARAIGEPWPRALGLGVLLQTKGLMELIVLTVLLQSGIISANVFAALVLMTVVSTALGMPMARLALWGKIAEIRQPPPSKINAGARTT